MKAQRTTLTSIINANGGIGCDNNAFTVADTACRSTDVSMNLPPVPICTKFKALRRKNIKSTETKFKT